MTSTQGERLSALVFAANAITDETLAGFGDLTAQQLNWKPSADQWSVAQCFDHLVTANESFFPIFERVLSGEDRNMKRKAITSICTIPAALFLLLIGIIHSIVNVSGLRRALVRGDIAARLGDSVLFNAAFSGLFMSLLGFLVLLLLPGLRKGSRQAGRVTTTIGIFIGLLGVVGYIRVPTKPVVLIFLFFGALLAAPYLIWRREFTNP